MNIIKVYTMHLARPRRFSMVKKIFCFPFTRSTLTTEIFKQWDRKNGKAKQDVYYEVLKSAPIPWRLSMVKKKIPFTHSHKRKDEAKQSEY